MKKFLFSLVCVLVSGELNVIAQDAKPKIVLQHEGNAYFYHYDKLESAISAASDGDTIYLSKGTYTCSTNKQRQSPLSQDYEYYISINKKIAFIGEGGDSTLIDVTYSNSNTYYSYTAVVDISIGTGTDSLTSTLFDGVGFLDPVCVTKDVKGLKMKKSSMTFQARANVPGTIIDRCTGSLYLGTYGPGSTVYNSNFSKIGSGALDVKFVNCNISSMEYNGYSKYYTNNYNESFYNCIISSPNNEATNAYYYCLLGNNNYKDGDYQNCWMNSQAYSLTSEELLEGNYIGSDGSIVGMYGGTTPYTLKTNLPRVTNYVADIDPTTKEITISLKVTSGN